MSKLLISSKKHDDLLSEDLGRPVLRSLPGSRQRLYLRLLIACGVTAALCGLGGLLLLSREYESGNEVANRLNILVRLYM